MSGCDLTYDAILVGMVVPISAAGMSRVVGLAVGAPACHPFVEAGLEHGDDREVGGADPQRVGLALGVSSDPGGVLSPVGGTVESPTNAVMPWVLSAVTQHSTTGTFLAVSFSRASAKRALGSPEAITPS